MFIKKNVNSSQILDIYNSQSRRFVSEGVLEVLQKNVSAGKKSVSIKASNYQRNVGSNISLRIGAWGRDQKYKDWDFGEARLNLDGVDDYVNIASSTSFNSSNFTIALWWYGTSAVGYGGPFNNRATGQYGFQLVNEVSATNTYQPHLVLWNGTAENAHYKISDSYSMPFSGPKHFVWSYNGTTARCWVDGAEKTVATSAVTNYPTSNIMIGRGYAYVNGTIDEVMFFNRSLEDREVRRIYEMGRDPGDYNDPSLVSWWGFNDRTANDTEGRNNGTLTSGASIAPTYYHSVACWHFDNSYRDTCRNVLADAQNQTNLNSVGVFNQSITFDGDGDYINDSNFSWSPGGQLCTATATVSFWSYAINLSGAFFRLNDQGNNSNLFTSWINSSDGKIYFNFGSNTAMANFTSYLRNWTHVVLSAGVFGSSARISLNGVPVNTTASISTLCSGLNGITIGADVNLSRFFNGSIDEFMIFNRTLSESEIQELYVKGRARWEYTLYQNLTATGSTDSSSSNHFALSDTNVTNILPCFKLAASPYQFYTPLISTNSSIFLNSALNNVTICNSSAGCLYVRNLTGRNKAVFDKFGNIDITGALTQGNAGTPSGRYFAIKNSSDSTVAWIDDFSGNFSIQGLLQAESASYCTAPSKSFVIKDNSGNCVTYIDSLGNLWARGIFNEQASI
jgi:hypothetical protein